jgi:hypothetical protein
MTRSERQELYLVLAAILTAMMAAIAWLSISDTTGAIPWIVAPVAIAGTPLLFPPIRHPLTAAAAIAMLLFCTYTGFSIGAFYWPSAVLLLIGARLNAGSRRERVNRPAAS